MEYQRINNDMEIRVEVKGPSFFRLSVLWILRTINSDRE